MREFISAVEDIEAEDEREAKIKALMESTDDKPGLSREDAEAQVDDDIPVEFKVDGRVLKAYKPTEGQLIFMLAALGRGQTQDQRIAAIVNIMLSALRGEDADYLEGRLLTRDRKKRLQPSTIEEIFEGLIEDWFRTDVSGSGTSVPDRG